MLKTYIWCHSASELLVYPSCPTEVKKKKFWNPTQIVERAKECYNRHFWMRMKLKAFPTLLGPSLREKIIFKNYNTFQYFGFWKTTFTLSKLSSNRINEFHSTYITWQMISKPQDNATIGQIYILVMYWHMQRNYSSKSKAEIIKYLNCNITFTCCNYKSYSELMNSEAPMHRLVHEGNFKDPKSPSISRRYQTAGC